MFITNRTARAGATRSPPLWRPAARTTSVRATSATPSPAIQNENLAGSRVTASGISTKAATSASGQFDHRSARKPEVEAVMQSVLVLGPSLLSLAVAGFQRGSMRRSDPARAAPGAEELLDPPAFFQELFLKCSNCVERRLGVLLLLLGQELEELRHMPEILLPVELRRPRSVPRPERQVGWIGIDRFQRALTARLGKGNLRLLRQPPLA